jgi:hypothetical protein
MHKCMCGKTDQFCNGSFGGMPKAKLLRQKTLYLETSVWETLYMSTIYII